MINEMAFGTYHDMIACELDDALRRYNEMWLKVLCQPEEARQRWAVAVEPRRLTVVVLTSCLVENAINFYLCTKCRTQEFNEIEGRGIIWKWTKGPRRFLPTYEMAGTSDLFKDLSALRERRGSVVHHKPPMSIDGDGRHQGNEPPGLLDEHSFVGRCASLPFRLVEHLMASDAEAIPDLFHIRLACGRAEGAFAQGQIPIRRVQGLPKELVEEIMAQGVERELAVLYAALIGPIPLIGGDGTIRVRSNGKELARLKPLKYFKTACQRVSDYLDL